MAVLVVLKPRHRVLSFLHYFSFVDDLLTHPPDNLGDLGCTMGFDCAPHRVPWRLKEGTPCTIWQVCAGCWAGLLCLHNPVLGFLFL